MARLRSDAAPAPCLGTLGMRTGGGRSGFFFGALTNSIEYRRVGGPIAWAATAIVSA